jgi:GNAT superfamily N-acetyltransferase
MELIRAEALGADDLAATEAIYLDAFPAELRGPFAGLFSDDMLVLLDDDRRPAGLALTRRLGPTGWVFLRYFAVAVRGRGAGSQLWRLACENWAKDGYTRVLLDVEDPAEPGIDAAEKQIRERRIVFYQRLGAELLPVHDYAPPQPGGHSHPFRLIAAGLVPGPGPSDSVRDQVLAVYRYRYELDAGDPAVRRTLERSGLT